MTVREATSDVSTALVHSVIHTAATVDMVTCYKAHDHSACAADGITYHMGRLPVLTLRGC